MSGFCNGGKESLRVTYEVFLVSDVMIITQEKPRGGGYFIETIVYFIKKYDMSL